MGKIYWTVVRFILKGIKRIAIYLLIFLISGCGISVTTSGIRAGLIDRSIQIQSECQIVTEQFYGLNLQWLPEWTLSDIRRWLKKEEEPEVVP